MTWFLEKLWLYFGAVGVASIALWLAAAGAMLALWPTRRRLLGLALGVLIGNAALVLAGINSRNISDIMPDRTERETRLARKRQAEEPTAGVISPAAREAARSATSQPAEDEGKSVYERAAEGEDPREAVEPAYRRRGKQQRKAGRKVEDATLAEVEQEVTEAQDVYRTMPLEDVMRADRWDTGNLHACRWVLGGALLLAAVTALLYCLHFNRTLGPRRPLPLASWWIDAVSAKRHTTALTGATPKALSAFLDTCVRKGETFCLLTDKTNPAAGKTFRRFDTCETLPVVPWYHLCEEYGPTLVLDGVWFGRLAGTIVGQADVATFLEEMLAYLRVREDTRAATRRTVNVVWWQITPPPDTWNELTRLARRANFRHVVCTETHTPPADLAFEEVLDVSAVPPENATR